MNAPVAVGGLVLRFLTSAGQILAFAITSVFATITTLHGLRLVAAQTALLFSRCLLPVALVVAPIAAMLTMQSMALTSLFGVDRLLAPLLTATVVRELSPAFSAVMICFQAGAGIAAELGTMRVQEEIDALEVMGVDARALVVGPRILGAAFCAPLLNAVGMMLGIAAAWLVAVAIGDLPHGVFVAHWLEGISIADFFLSEVKALIFGLLLGSVAASKGYFASGGTSGVGRAANHTVVASVILVLVANYLLNTALFGLRGNGVF